MDNEIRDKIVLDLKNKYYPININNNETIRELIKDIEIKLDEHKAEFSNTYLIHKADVIFKRVLHDK